MRSVGPDETAVASGISNTFRQVGAVFGVAIATAIFANEVGLVYGHWQTLGIHLAGLVGVAAFSFLGSWALFRITDAILPLRVSAEQEAVGLDLSQPGESIQIQPLST